MIVFATSERPPIQSERENPWPGCTITWIAYDPELGGTTVWDLTKGTEGVTAMAGLIGLGAPEETIYEDVFAGQDGSRFRGFNALPRDVFMPVRVRNVPGVHHGSLGFIDLDAAFWRTLDSSRVGTLRFTRPDGMWRELRLRYIGESEYAPVTEASLTGREIYGLRFRAHQPYWEAEAVTKLWRSTPPRTFFPGPAEAAGAVVGISSSVTFENATLTNPGETRAHIVWTGKGPFASLQVGLAGKPIVVPFEIPDGKAVVLNTREKTAVVYDLTFTAGEKDPQDWIAGLDIVNPVDRTKDLGTSYWSPVPAGSDITLGISGPGTAAGIGSVAAKLTPLYKRAR